MKWMHAMLRVVVKENPDILWTGWPKGWPPPPYGPLVVIFWVCAKVTGMFWSKSTFPYGQGWGGLTVKYPFFYDSPIKLKTHILKLKKTAEGMNFLAARWNMSSPGLKLRLGGGRWGRVLPDCSKCLIKYRMQHCKFLTKKTNIKHRM